MSTPALPGRLVSNCEGHPERSAWLANLPIRLDKIAQAWSLTLQAPFTNATVAWVSPVICADSSSAILKIGLPHMEARDEADGLAFWNGDGAVRLLKRDDELGAILMERCEPGDQLQSLPEPEQDEVIAGLLKRLWRVPSPEYNFRPLSVMFDLWISEVRETEDQWPDRQLVEDGIQTILQLLESTSESTLLTTDLHSANVLRSTREPWLMIDPKPFVGDPAFDATQHLLNCRERMQHNPIETMKRFSDLLGVDSERVRLWTFARMAADWYDELWQAVAREISASF